MAFSRAPIKRFNEPPDSGIPPPNAYNPKFATDVSVIAANAKGGSAHDKPVRQTSINGNVSCLKSRSEDTELLQQQQQQQYLQQQQSVGRLSRDSSFVRKSATKVDGPPTSAPDAGKREPATPNTQQLLENVKSRIRSRTSTSSTSSVTRNSNASVSVTGNVGKSPSTCNAGSSSRTSCSPNPDRRNAEMTESTDENKERFQNSLKGHKSSTAKLNANNEKREPENESGMCHEVILEIQNMAQSLQVEVAEYKRRLSSEIIRCKELESKKIELEFTIKSLMREIEKHEASRQSWEESDIKQQTKMEDLNIKVAHLEQQIDDLQVKLVRYKDSEEILLEKVAKLESEIVSLQKEKLQLQTTLEELQRLVEKEERKFAEAEEKCKELASQMESCYHVCENRTQEMENMKEVFEVKIQELTQQKDDLLKELDSARRELETQKTLMDLAKNEEKEKEQPLHDDYIS